MVIKIKTTFASITPESAEVGELSDQGWLDEEGSEFEDVDEVVDYLKGEGAMEPSSSCPHIGVWYSTEMQIEDFATGEQMQKSFHISGATPEEEEEKVRERALSVLEKARAGEDFADLAKKYGTGLVLNTDTHMPEDLRTDEQALETAKSCGLSAEDLKVMFDNSRKLVNKVFK